MMTWRVLRMNTPKYFAEKLSTDDNEMIPNQKTRFQNTNKNWIQMEDNYSLELIDNGIEK